MVDFDLLERVAVELPHASLVLIGDATHPMERFDKHPNVHWLGFRPYSAIPAYGSAFDVATEPSGRSAVSSSPTRTKPPSAPAVAVTAA